MRTSDGFALVFRNERFGLVALADLNNVLAFRAFRFRALRRNFRVVHPIDFAAIIALEFHPRNELKPKLPRIILKKLEIREAQNFAGFQEFKRMLIHIHRIALSNHIQQKCREIFFGTLRDFRQKLAEIDGFERQAKRHGLPVNEEFDIPRIRVDIQAKRQNHRNIGVFNDAAVGTIHIQPIVHRRDASGLIRSGGGNAGVRRFGFDDAEFFPNLI